MSQAHGVRLTISRLLGAPALAALLIGCAADVAAQQPGSPLFVDCRGVATSAPTVLLEAGAFGTSADWDFVLDDLAKGGRACAFDRAGLGRSVDRPGGRDALAKADEIAAVLDQIDERAPVILVGHSNGALYVEAFAALWPNRVAGLVYVNGVDADALDDPGLRAELVTERRASDLAVTAGRLGLSGVVADVLSRPMALRGEASARKRQDLHRLAMLKAARDEDRQILAGLAAVKQLPPVPASIPVVVIVGAPRLDAPAARRWRAAELAPARHAQTAWILDMAGATHVSPLTRDRAYLAAAVAWLRSRPSATTPAD